MTMSAMPEQRTHFSQITLFLISWSVNQGTQILSVCRKRRDSSDPFFAPDNVADNGYKVCFEAGLHLQPFHSYLSTTAPIRTETKTEPQNQRKGQRTFRSPTNENVNSNLLLKG